MPDVTASAEQVGQMLLDAMRNAIGMDPHHALTQAQAQHGVTADMVNGADMGKVFDYMCSQPGLSPEMSNYLTSAQGNYNNYGNINQGGSTYSGGSGGSGSYGGSGSSVPNTRVVEQITNNYATTHVNDNHIDINGPVSGDISIDQQNNQVEANGDHNAVNTGSGNQNAATGDHSSAAQSNGPGDAQSNSGDHAVQGGLIVGPTNTGTFTGIQTLGGTVHDSPVGEGNTVLDNSGGGQIHDSSIGFGSGDVSNASHDTASGGSAIGGHDATGGTNVDLNFGSTVNTNTGSGQANQGYGEPVREPVRGLHSDAIGEHPHTIDPVHFDHTVNVPTTAEPLNQTESVQEHPHEAAVHDSFSPEINVNVEGHQQVDTGHEDVLHHG